MNARISVVKNIKVLSVSESSIVHVGDAINVKPRSKLIEVGRELPSFIENEVNFSDYPLFNKPIPQPIVQEDVQMVVKNESPWIKVNQVNILGIIDSSVFQVGSSKLIDTESRKKQIRQLLHNQAPKANP
jgi:spore germination protein PE